VNDRLVDLLATVQAQARRYAWVLGLFAALGVLVLAPAAPLRAEQPQKVYKLGYLTPFPVPPAESRFTPEYRMFEDTLRERGYVLGQNLSIEYRTSEGHDERLPGLVDELLRLKIDVLLTDGTIPTRAAQRATRTTPIVMVTVLDPVSAGFVNSLAHPGGNITGSSELAEDLVAKRLELLKQLLPKASRVAVLWDPAHPTNALDLRRTEEAAHALGLTVRGVGAHELPDIERGLAEVRQWHPDALVVLTSGASIGHAARIVELANRSKLPTVYGAAPIATVGALLGYGPDFLDQGRHAALFVDQILKGAAPADLPVRLPTKFRLAINLGTAKAIGLDIPQAVLLRADDIIP
jgi:putative ABC transport system substrate-binding protein